MTDISLSTTTTTNTKKAHQFFLYFSYFIFLFPYILKLLSFLSPLFVTTSLLLLVLLTLSTKTNHYSTTAQLSEPNNFSFVFSWLQRTFGRLFSSLQLRVTEDHDHLGFEELEVYKIVFDTSLVENPSEVLEMEAKDIYLVGRNETGDSVGDHHQKVSGFEIPSRVSDRGINGCDDQILTVGNSVEKLEDLLSNKADKEAEKHVKSEKVEEDHENMKEGSNAITSQQKVSRLTIANSTSTTTTSTSRSSSSTSTTSFDFDDDNSECYGTPKESKCWSPIRSNGIKNMNMNLGSFGSMRREKEWRRTLACKLFEERHSNVNVDVRNSSEGMDLLWETYQETEHTTVPSHKNPVMTKVKSKSKTKKGQKKTKNNIDNYYHECEEEEEEEEHEQLCCLQALKFSTGKMNLVGMGKPNLVKFSKAVKGFGWLHHHVNGRHCKKVSP